MKQRRHAVLACLLLAALTLAAFAPTRLNGFVSYDDRDYVAENPHVQGGLNWAGAVWAFGTGYAGNWHPLTWLSHMMDVQLFGLRAAGHHGTSLLLHAANVILLFLLLRRLTGMFWRSLCVAALFALHPLRVESVAWVAERKDVLSGFFFLLTLCAYARYAQVQSPVASNGATQHEARNTRLIFYLLSLLFFALGLMSKPMLVTLPFVLLLLDYWPLRRLSVPLSQHSATSPLRLVLEKFPFFALATASCVVTFVIQRGAGAVSSIEAMPLELRLSNAAISCVRYASKMVWPAGLAAFYPMPAGWPAAWVAGALLVLAGVSALAVCSARKAPWFLFGWCWYLGTLVPVIGIVQVGQQALADRYSYIPLIGLSVAVVWAGGEMAARWPGIGKWLAAGALMAIAACALLTWKQTGYWRNSASLFGHALAVTRDNYVAHNNLGAVLMDEGNLAVAEEHFAEAVRVKCNYPEGLGNLGLCRLKQGRLEEAAGLLERSLDVRPTAVVHYNLANLLSQQGKLDEAQAHYETALRLKPEFVEAWYNLGLLEAKRGRPAEAVRDYETALRLRPDHAESHLSLGTLLAAEHRGEEALAHFRAAVRAAPENADAHFNLAFALNGIGDYAGAAEHYAEVCRLHPEDAEARSNQALALLCAGQMARAAELYREVLRVRPAAPAHYYLGLALDSMGRAEEAVVHYREALRLGPDTPLYLNDLAWALATSPKSELRDGIEAVRLARRACELTGGREARFCGTLDAAYAEAGRFTDALAMAAQTRELALTAGQPDIARQAEERMVFYRAGKPWRTAPPPQANPTAEGHK